MGTTSALQKLFLRKPSLRSSLILTTTVGALLAAGTYITVDSVNRVSAQPANYANYRWEVSSADTGNPSGTGLRGAWQHLRIKTFFGTSANAVKTQIWIAVSIYVLVAMLKKRLALEPSRYQILPVLSVTLFEKVPMRRAFDEAESQNKLDGFSNQLNLFGL